MQGCCLLDLSLLLHKIKEYAEKLQHMIPDGHDLDDWMRSHISQAADDISEVYAECVAYEWVIQLRDHKPSRPAA